MRTTGVQRSADGVQLNFEQAEIRDVVKVILGDILHRSYTVDSDVQGQVTLSTAAPMSEGDLLAVLETVLRANGATLVETSPTSYRIMPVDSAIGPSQVVPIGGSPLQVRPGYGITIVPLRNISATSAAQFIQPLVASPEDIRIDPGRNAILFSGTGIERQNVVDTLADLDVDWMAGKTIGLFPLQRANAEAVIPELQAIFAPFDPSGAEPSLTRFLPLARLNAILAIAGDPQQVREIGAWVSRLDHGQAVGSQYYVYNLKHASADDVAKLLNDAFSEGPSSSSTGPSLAAASSTLGAAQPFAEDNEGGGGETTGTSATTTAPSTGTSSTSSGPVKVVASKANNSLLIRATPDEYERIQGTLLRLDTAPWQVLIEATIAEVQLNDQLRYGVQYFLEAGSFAGGFTRSAVANAVGPVLAPGFSFLFTPGSSQITIDALSQLTQVKVLSAPSVVVQDNSEAVLNVSQEIPVQTQAQQSVQAVSNVLNSFEYRDVGVILQVKPRINSNQAVSLEIAQEVSRCDNCTPTQLNPTFTKRKITSRVNVQSGQTVVLGGLIQDNETRIHNGIPLLSEIPVVGNLFGTTDNVNQRNELIVFITPRVIRNTEDARDVSEELRSRLRSLQSTDGQTLGSPAPYIPAPGQRPPATYPQPLIRPTDQPAPGPYGLSPAPNG
jgi:general secretion pathway protein D